LKGQCTAFVLTDDLALCFVLDGYVWVVCYVLEHGLRLRCNLLNAVRVNWSFYSGRHGEDMEYTLSFLMLTRH
jgi:hypothetical protein